LRRCAARGWRGRVARAGLAGPNRDPHRARLVGAGDGPLVVSSLAGSEVRLAELVGSMSLATDLGLGQPMEHVLRSCVLGLRIAEDLELGESERAVVYYVALLAWLGCHADAHEQSARFGDDIQLRADRHLADSVDTRFILSHVGRGEPVSRRVVRLGSLLVSGRGALVAMETTHCMVAGLFAMRLGLGIEVRDGLQHVFERWDGKGTPAGIAGEEIALSARIAVIADIVESFRRLGGVAAAVDVARRRAGGQFDPRLAGHVCANAEGLLGGLDEATGWDAAIGAEPVLAERMSGVELDDALAAIADFADLKSPYTTGHSRGVAERAASAALRAGLGAPAAAELRRAGLLHDVGRLGVSNTIWDKPGVLSEAEMERVRMHPYLTQRTFSRSPRLATLAEVAATHHERLDGSGYPRALAGGALSPEARILAAADAYQAMSEPRPHRGARPPDDAARQLREDVRRGRLDADAVDAVLGAAGHRVPRRREGPAGLTRREVEVLVLLARGLSTKAIAAQLVVSPKTVDHHIQHIYRKIDCSTRAAASLFAMQHGLLPELE
jgi:HD-GYP domain-containing protein (c-di-GMP phosphodiesterase class II)